MLLQHCLMIKMVTELSTYKIFLATNFLSCYSNFTEKRCRAFD